MAVEQIMRIKFSFQHMEIVVATRRMLKGGFKPSKKHLNRLSVLKIDNWKYVLRPFVMFCNRIGQVSTHRGRVSFSGDNKRVLRRKNIK